MGVWDPPYAYAFMESKFILFMNNLVQKLIRDWRDYQVVIIARLRDWIMLRSHTIWQGLPQSYPVGADKNMFWHGFTGSDDQEQVDTFLVIILQGHGGIDTQA